MDTSGNWLRVDPVVMVHIALITVMTAVVAALLTHAPLLQAQDSAQTFRFYEYSATGNEQRHLRKPRLGAAHAISLSSELFVGLSELDVQRIRSLGPWLTEDGLSDNAQVLIRTIQDARVHGLNPESYELRRILRTVDLLSQLDKWASELANDQQENRKAAERALRRQLGGLLDDNFVKLAEHLGQGVVNGRKLQNRLYRDAPVINAFNLLVSISSARLSVDEALTASMPSHPAYRRLMQTMRNLLTEQSTGGLRTKVRETNDAQLVMQAQDKQAIRERLLETGDLSFDAYIAVNADAKLLTALRTFQARHGIEQSSFADEKTRAALNTSVKQDIQAVAISLERWRWLPRDLGERHIFVNVPDFHVDLIEKGKISLSMPVVVGTVENQTPSFSRDMTYMEFNPTWTVPDTIAVKELLPKERATPGYLTSRNFDFLKRVGKHLITVPPDSITREDFNAVDFPYILQQRGGSMNALGRMKFMMPNQYAIYLHDTQAKKHFTLNDRAYSHGCIRVSDPDSLAQHLMLGDGYSQAGFESSLNSTKTHRVRFRNPIPTHLVYLTTWVDDNNKLQKRPDLYRNDARLTLALKLADTLISIK